MTCAFMIQQKDYDQADEDCKHGKIKKIYMYTYHYQQELPLAIFFGLC